MSHPIAVDILSDDEEEQRNDDFSTPLPTQSKKQRTKPNLNPSVFVIDDDPTPQKPAGHTSTPSFVPETPMSILLKSDISIVKCTTNVSDPQLGSSWVCDHKVSGINGLICLESDNESENVYGWENCKQSDMMDIVFDVANDTELNSKFVKSTFYTGNNNLKQISGDNCLQPVYSEGDTPQVQDQTSLEIDRLELADNVLKQKGRSKANANKKKDMNEASGKRKTMKEERIRLMEEKKQQKEQEKLQKAAQKAEAAEMKKLQKEKLKWEKGKFALKSIVAEIDTKVVELGSVGGHLLTRFAEKDITYHIKSNQIERSIVWTMSVPEQISQGTRTLQETHKL